MELKSTFEIGRPEPYCSLTTASRNAQPGLRVGCVTNAAPFQTGSLRVANSPNLCEPCVDCEASRRIAIVETSGNEMLPFTNERSPTQLQALVPIGGCSEASPRRKRTV